MPTTNNEKMELMEEKTQSHDNGELDRRLVEDSDRGPIADEAERSST